MGFLVKQRLFFGGEGGGLGLYEHVEICLLYIYLLDLLWRGPI